MNQSHFICLVGLSGSGKDTAGEHLVETRGFVRVAIADRLKEIVAEIFDLTHDQLWGELRNTPDARLGKAPRQIYQQFGADCLALDSEVWLRPWTRTVQGHLDQGQDVVCTDVRTIREMEAAREMGAEIWRIERPGAGAPGNLGLHATETALIDVPADLFDRVLLNDSDISALFTHINAALD